MLKPNARAPLSHPLMRPLSTTTMTAGRRCEITSFSSHSKFLLTLRGVAKLPCKSVGGFSYQPQRALKKRGRQYILFLFCAQLMESIHFYVLLTVFIGIVWFGQDPSTRVHPEDPFPHHHHCARHAHRILCHLFLLFAFVL